VDPNPETGIFFLRRVEERAIWQVLGQKKRERQKGGEKRKGLDRDLPSVRRA
jgi:hypothetical protein